MDAAEKNIRYVLATRTDDPGATLLLGLVSEAKGDYSNAVRLLISQFDLVTSQPDRTVALFHAIYQTGARSDVARIVDVLKLRAADPAWASAIGRCAEIATKSGDRETSEVLDSLIPANGPPRLAAELERATVLYNAGKTAEAQQLLSQLSDSKPKDDNIQALLGRCYESMHQPALALRAFQRALDLAPSRVERYEDLISLQLDLGLIRDAESLVNRLMALAPNDARSWLMKGNMELRTNAFRDALKSYTRASDLDKGNADALLGRAAVDSVLGLNDDTVNDYQAGLDRFPDDARFYIAFAAMLLASSDSTQAYTRIEGLLHQAVKLDPRSPDAHYQLGQVALRQSKLEEAKSEFLVSLEADPDRSNTHFALSLVYRRMGQTTNAAEQFAIYEKLKQIEEHEAAMSDQSVEKP
jgi:tetratricopeptide (TPR) repeat protein